jgi:hypothetical protein
VFNAVCVVLLAQPWRPGAARSGVLLTFCCPFFFPSRCRDLGPYGLLSTSPPPSTNRAGSSPRKQLSPYTQLCHWMRAAAHLQPRLRACQLPQPSFASSDTAEASDPLPCSAPSRVLCAHLLPPLAPPFRFLLLCLLPHQAAASCPRREYRPGWVAAESCCLRAAAPWLAACSCSLPVPCTCAAVTCHKSHRECAGVSNRQARD